MARCKKFNSKSDTLWKNVSENWFLSCFSGSHWMMNSSVNVETNLFHKTEVNDKVCFGFIYQMYNWKLPQINSPLNFWGRAFWQHTIFIEPIKTTLWSINCSRSAVFLKIHIRENKLKCTLFRIFSIFSNVFVWATMRRRAMERSWHLHNFYPTLPARRYLPQSLHLLKLTMLNAKSIFKTCVAQNIT